MIARMLSEFSHLQPFERTYWVTEVEINKPVFGIDCGVEYS